MNFELIVIVTLIFMAFVVKMIADSMRPRNPQVSVPDNTSQILEISEKLDAIMWHMSIDVESTKIAKREALIEKLREVLRRDNTHGAKDLTIMNLQRASGSSYDDCKDVVENSGLWSPFDTEIDRYAYPIS